LGDKIFSHANCRFSYIETQIQGSNAKAGAREDLYKNLKRPGIGVK
jgi:hypothetical protein